MWGTQDLKSTLERLREDFGRLATRVATLELSAPAVTASLLNASDQLKRMAARAERTKLPTVSETDPDEQEIDELMADFRKR
jgi:hypothetical protein